MITQKLQAVVLAAGKSSRFNTKNSKLSYKLCGQEMIAYPAKLLNNLRINTTLVVGYQKELIKEILNKYDLTNINYVEQKEQSGTGHALMCTENFWNADNILVMNGDMPLVSQSLVEELIEKHQKTEAAITFIIAHNDDPTLPGYGRMVEENGTIKIVEAKEFNGDTNTFCWVNAGIYIIRKDFLKDYKDLLTTNRTSGEIYITDLISIASTNEEIVSYVKTSFDQVRGVNTLKELWTAEQIKRSELIAYWKENGAYFSLAQSVHIDLDVTIGAGTIVGIGAQLLGKTKVGSRVQIGVGSVISNSLIHDDAFIYPCCVITDSEIQSESKIGPFAHIKDKSNIGKKSSIGNFVEVTRSTLGEKTKAKHLSYTGDALVGSNVNIGAGTIVCNYDGFNKNKTFIEDNVLVGSNNSLVAPITICENSITAAGSVITEDVPKNSLAIGRSKQINKEGYASKLKEKLSKKIKKISPAKIEFQELT